MCFYDIYNYGGGEFKWEITDPPSGQIPRFSDIIEVCADAYLRTLRFPPSIKIVSTPRGASRG
jgi:hypothetical protein